MLVTGKARFVGMRSGTKDGRRWANVTLDAHDDLLERFQIFVSEEALINQVATFTPGVDVSLEVRLYSNQQGNVGARLQKIEIDVKAGK